MMHFHIMTLFPEMVMAGLGTSITGRAIDRGLLSIDAVNIRDYAFNKHNSVDDYPYGGGAGMLMQAEPVYLTYEAIREKINSREGKEASQAPRVIYLSPQGKTFSQEMAEELAKEEDLILLCGHYEGIDERVLEEIVTDYAFHRRLCTYRRRTSGYGNGRYYFQTLVPGFCITMFLQSLKAFRTISWNIPSIPDRKFGMTSRCRLFFYQGIMPMWKKWRKRAVRDPYGKEPAGSS